MPLFLPELGAYVADEKPMRDCEFPQCPLRQKGYKGCSMKACGKCKAVRYCSKDCQRSHWRTHKQQCGAPEPQNPTAWLESKKHLLRWMAIEALRLHTDSSAFESGKMPRALTLVVHHGKQGGAFNSSGIELFHARVKPSTQYDLLFCSSSKGRNEEIQAAGGMGALTVTCAFVDAGRRAAKGAGATCVPLVLEYPEPPNPNYQYMPATRWEALFRTCINEEKPLSSIEEDLHALPGGCRREGDAGWGLLQELKGGILTREVEMAQDEEIDET